ncbi:MAG: ABC transporter permease [Candidatus Sumerlaeota bacterium]|nr:ABC transporter permease [Candidatus Sumerlaeota bacterium]
MRFASYLLFIRRHLMGSKLRALAAVAGVAAAALVWMMAAGAGWMALREIAPRLEAVFPANRLVVRPQVANLLILQMGPSRITEDQIKDISSWPGVASVARQTAITFPISAHVSLLGNEIDTDAIVNGVDRQLVASEIAPDQTFAYDSSPSATVPVVASRYFLEMYNLGYAESQSLPRVNESAVIGRRFTLILGESICTGPSERKRELECRIVGLTRNISLIGLVVPYEYAQAWNRWYHGKRSEGCTALHVSTASAADYAEIEQRLAKAGLNVESHRDLLQRTRLTLALVTAGVGGFGALVLALAGLNLWNTFTLILMQQREQIGILRAVGAAPGSVFMIYAGEALLVTAMGCAIGGGLGASVFLFLRGPLASFTAAYDFIGVLRLEPALGAALLTLPLVMAFVCLFALPQIARAARRPISELL